MSLNNNCFAESRYPGSSTEKQPQSNSMPRMRFVVIAILKKNKSQPKIMAADLGYIPMIKKIPENSSR